MMLSWAQDTGSKMRGGITIGAGGHVRVAGACAAQSTVCLCKMRRYKHAIHCETPPPCLSHPHLARFRALLEMVCL
jgi:hypothetical protein